MKWQNAGLLPINNTMMKKIDLHLHLTPFQIPKLGKMNLTSGSNMLPHLEELGQTLNKNSGTETAPLLYNKEYRLLDTELLADILGDSVLVNNDVHGLVASKCL